MDGASGPRASGVSPRGGSAAGAGSVHSSSTTPPPSTLHSVNGLAHDAHAHTNGGAPPPLVPVTHTPTGGLHDLSGLSAAAASVAQALLHETALRLTRHQYKEAIVAYDRILELTPTFIPAWTGKGVCYKALKDHVSAVHCFQRGLQLDPTDWAAHDHLGLIFKETERFEQAMEQYKLAIHYGPKDCVAREHLAVVMTDYGTRLKLAGSTDLAVASYSEALTVHPAYWPAYFNLGVVYSERGEFDLAMRHYQLAIDRNPNYVEALCNIGVIFKNAGELALSIEYYDRALKANPNFAIANSNLSIALTDMGTAVKNEGRLDEGIAYYKRALHHHSKYPAAWYNLGVAYAEKCRFDDAKVCYEMAVLFDAKCAEAYNNLGVIYKDRGNLDQAIHYYVQALHANPKFSQTMNNCLLATTRVAIADGRDLTAEEVDTSMHLIGQDGEPVGVKAVVIGHCPEMVEIVHARGAHTVTPNHLVTLRWASDPEIDLAPAAIPAAAAANATAQHANDACVALRLEWWDRHSLRRQSLSWRCAPMSESELPSSDLLPVLPARVRSHAHEFAQWCLQKRELEGRAQPLRRGDLFDVRADRLLELFQHDPSFMARVAVPLVHTARVAVPSFPDAPLEEVDVDDAIPPLVDDVAECDEYDAMASDGDVEALADEFLLTLTPPASIAVDPFVDIAVVLPAEQPDTTCLKPTDDDADADSGNDQFEDAVRATIKASEVIPLEDTNLTTTRLVSPPIEEGEEPLTYRPAHDLREIDVVYMLHSPLVKEPLLPSHHHHHTETKSKSYTLLQLERAWTELGLDAGYAKIMLADLHPLDDTARSDAPPRELNPHTYRAAITAALHTTKPRVIVAFGSHARDQWQSHLHSLPGVARVSSEPASSKLAAGGAPRSTLSLTLADGREVRVVFAPHPTAGWRFGDLLASLSLAHDRPLDSDATEQACARASTARLLAVRSAPGGRYAAIEVEGHDKRFVLSDHTLTHNCGVIYTMLGKLDEAHDYCSRAIQTNPLYAEAHNNLGVLYRDEGRIAEAIASYEACLRIDPLSRNAGQNRLLAMNSLSRAADAANDANKALVPSTNGKTHPLSDADAIGEIVWTAHRVWGVQFAQLYERERYTSWEYIHDASSNEDAVDTSSSPPDADISPDSASSRTATPVVPGPTIPAALTTRRPLRIGYISADYFTHSVSYFIEAPIAYADPAQTHITCYSNVARRDKKTAHLQGLAHAWRSVHDQTARQVAAQIRRDRIDILVELTGHTAGNRLDVLALKPAPIQVTWIGYPNTTGLPSIDYRFSDAIVDPLDTRQQYSEELVRLDGPFLCYTPPVDAPPVAPTPAASKGYITFGSFNNLAKVNDAVLDAWCRILRAVPHSRMLIKCKPFASPTVCAKMWTRFGERGVAAERVDLVSLLPTTSEHLDSYGLVDISVDTFPYAGTTTTCEALYCGVPVVTFQRVDTPNHAHNVGASLLTRIEGMSELIAKSEDEYVSIAVSLANDLPKLRRLRASLRPAMLASPLCDGRSFVRGLTRTYQQLWERFCKGEGPKPNRR